MKFINKINNKYLELLPDFSQEKTERYTSLILSLIALSVFGLFAINPTLSTIAKLQKEIEDSKVLSQRLEDKIADLATLQQSYKKLENDIPTVFESMPNAPLVPILIGQIQSIARDSSLRVVQIQNGEAELFAQVDPSRKYYFYTFSVVADGAYENILNFTDNLTNLQRIVSIKAVSINNQSDTAGALQLNLEGIAYYKR
jgi:Tfp pilus assembly protein PilO